MAEKYISFLWFPPHFPLQIMEIIYYLILAYCKKVLLLFIKNMKGILIFLPFLGKNYLDNLALLLIKYRAKLRY